ncbi:MAG: hypothetical protein MN733_13855 [Nitrososphaera sp.]|nr:hypothetical protein [Nitrososphaera sp.]
MFRFFTSLVLQLLAVSFVLACSYYEKPIYALGAGVVVILYTIFACWESNGQATKLESHADEVYFIGYLSTIAAFAGIVVGIWLKGGDIPANPRPILLMSGVALGTTALGLFSMILLRNYARKKRGDSALEYNGLNEKVLKAVEQLQEVGIENTKRLFKSYSEEIITITNKSATTIKDLNERLEDLRTNVEKLKNYVDQGADCSQQFVANVKELQDVIDDFVKLLKSELRVKGQSNDPKVI